MNEKDLTLLFVIIKGQRWSHSIFKVQTVTDETKVQLRIFKQKLGWCESLPLSSVDSAGKGSM